MHSLKIPKGCKVRSVQFGGRIWTVVNVPWPRRVVGPLDASAAACVELDMSVILFRSCFPRDAQIVAVVHELLHIPFDTLSERALKHGDGHFVDSLQAFGVDLSPLLEGYE